MEIIPAIDIRDSRCVRLYQGDYEQETVFDDNPATVALRWKSQGARWLHVVDLDGARAGEPRNVAVVQQLVDVSGLLVELGGGVRREDVVEELLGKGVMRIIVGTVAVENPRLVKRLIGRFGEAVIVGLDARDGRIAVRGWQKDTETDVLVLAREMVGIGVGRFIYTDVKRDGTLTEPNFEAIERLAGDVSVPIVASGGICKLEHLVRLKQLGVDGCVVGKALYTGDINLREAIATVS